MSEIADIIKKETYGNVTIEADKNAMKYNMHVIQRVLSFDTDNSVALLLVFKKQVHLFVIYTASIIFDIRGFITININCIFISGMKDYSYNSDILYTFNLTEPPGYMLVNIRTNVIYQNVTKK